MVARKFAYIVVETSLRFDRVAQGSVRSGQDRTARLFRYDPQGDGKWKGKAFNPEDSKTYTGMMSLSGNSLTTAGCVFGGLICKSAKWSRVH